MGSLDNTGEFKTANENEHRKQGAVQSQGSVSNSRENNSQFPRNQPADLSVVNVVAFSLVLLTLLTLTQHEKNDEIPQTALR